MIKTTRIIHNTKIIIFHKSLARASNSKTSKTTATVLGHGMIRMVSSQQEVTNQMHLRDRISTTKETSLLTAHLTNAIIQRSNKTQIHGVMNRKRPAGVITRRMRGQTTTNRNIESDLRDLWPSTRDHPKIIQIK